MIFAAILAGGSGTRVGGNIPKQFLELNGKPILINTINKFLSSQLVDIIYISVNEIWMKHTEELLEEHYDTDTVKNFRLVCGGKERMMSFLNVIYDIKDTFGINL